MWPNKDCYQPIDLHPSIGDRTDHISTKSIPDRVVDAPSCGDRCSSLG
jgi:hypothetical protein